MRLKIGIKNNEIVNNAANFVLGKFKIMKRFSLSVLLLLAILVGLPLIDMAVDTENETQTTKTEPTVVAAKKSDTVKTVSHELLAEKGK